MHAWLGRGPGSLRLTQAQTGSVRPTQAQTGSVRLTRLKTPQCWARGVRERAIARAWGKR